MFIDIEVEDMESGTKKLPKNWFEKPHLETTAFHENQSKIVSF